MAPVSEPVHQVTETQADLLRGLVSANVRKTQRGIRALRAKHGDGFDSTRERARLRLLVQTYRALGGDPARMTVLEPLPPEADQ